MFNHLIEMFPEDFVYKPRIRSSICNLLHNYLERHNKSLIIRFCVRFPTEHQPGRKEISRFIETLKHELQKNYLDPSYIWVREQVTSEHPHFHVVFFVNGNKVQNPTAIYQLAEMLWNVTLNTNYGGLVEFERYCSVRKCDYDYPQQLEYAINMLSYIAKDFSKGPINDGYRDFGMTRTPRYA